MDFKNKFEQRKIENAMLHRAYDEKMYAFFKELDQKRKNNKFQSWLDTYIDYTNYMYDDELDDNTEIIQIRSIIASFVSNLKDVIEQSGYTINDEKSFKDEIASMIYRTSV